MNDTESEDDDDESDFQGAGTGASSKPKPAAPDKKRGGVGKKKDAVGGKRGKDNKGNKAKAGGDSDDDSDFRTAPAKKNKKGVFAEGQQVMGSFFKVTLA